MKYIKIYKLSLKLIQVTKKLQKKNYNYFTKVEIINWEIYEYFL